MKHIPLSEYPAAEASAGVNRVRFAGMNMRIVECEQGCVIANHGHEHAEEVYVLSGRIRLNDDILGPGDLHRTEAGESHEAEALEKSRFLVTNPVESE